MSTLEVAAVDPTAMSEKDIEALLAEEESQAEEGAPAGTEKDDWEDRKDQDLAKPAETKAEPAKDDPETVADVATPDGKNTIPYSVLATARRNAQAAETARRAAEELAQTERGQREVLEQQLRDLQSSAAAAAAKPGAQVADPNEIVSAEDLEALEDAAPEMAKIFKGLIGKINTLTATVETERQRAERLESEQRQDRTRSTQEVVETAIANQPKIVFLRENAPEQFNDLVEYDKFLLSQPQWQNPAKIADRIAKSLAMYEAANGPVQMPATATQAKSAPAPKPAAAEPAPHSLSDIPGGGVPATNEVDGLGDLSADVLTQKFMQMNPADVDKLVARMNF